MSDQEEDDNDAGHHNPQNLVNQIQQMLEQHRQQIHAAMQSMETRNQAEIAKALANMQINPNSNSGQPQRPAQTGQQPGSGQSRQQQLVVPVLVPSSPDQDDIDRMTEEETNRLELTDEIRQLARNIKSAIDDDNSSDVIEHWTKLKRRFEEAEQISEIILQGLDMSSSRKDNRKQIDDYCEPFEKTKIVVETFFDLQKQANLAHHAPRPVYKISTPDKPKLPKIDYGKFDGNSTKWNAWWTRFEDGIHSNKNIADADKFTYLSQLLSGEPKEMVDGYDYTPGNYKMLIIKLNERYGRKSIIYSAHLKALKSIPPIYNDSNIIKIYEYVTKHTQSIIDMGYSEDTFAAFVIDEILTNMPIEITKKWREKWGGKDPNYKAVISALTSEVNTIIQEEAQRGSITPGQTASFHGHAKGIKGKGRESGSDKGKIKQCIFCKGQHSAHQCTAGTITDRLRKVSKDKRCKACLSTKHIQQDCKSEFNCKHCKKTNHSAALCFFKHGKPLKKLTINEDDEVHEPSTSQAASQTTSQTTSQAPPQATGVQTPKPAIKKQLSTYVAVESQESGESDNESIPEFLTMNADSGDNILLPMVTILVQGADGKKHRALGLMDSGSQRSFICKNLSDKLGLDSVRTERLQIHSFGNSNSGPRSHKIFNVPVQGTQEGANQIKIQLLETNFISEIATYQPTEFANRLHAEGYSLADDRIIHRGMIFSGIDILIGCDQYWWVMGKERFE